MAGYTSRVTTTPIKLYPSSHTHHRLYPSFNWSSIVAMRGILPINNVDVSSTKHQLLHCLHVVHKTRLRHQACYSRQKQTSRL